MGRLCKMVKTGINLRKETQEHSMATSLSQRLAKLMGEVDERAAQEINGMKTELNGVKQNLM